MQEFRDAISIEQNMIFQTLKIVSDVNDIKKGIFPSHNTINYKTMKLKMELNFSFAQNVNDKISFFQALIVEWKLTLFLNDVTADLKSPSASFDCSTIISLLIEL